MNARDLISALGGTEALTAETGLSEGRISQWRTANYIPKPWVKFLRARFPTEVDWDALALADREVKQPAV
ncbi:hypothetical protein [Cupriavidus sp.]|uniref:hypothetical protein n=1 Tax=Cupriavidus sp. TaxID=1873897 RepID=UPI0025BE37AD|nr:hypothetical protein [Cupriavidus sp.]MCA3186307.1 hypothetical protein [Cupriavidus sp.]MCA3190943.1 hypothetical protein [Cupriavidus sp.]MCA3199287.1 hypothetical protein [Cupriavidus sp.]MCA3204554.1 hypothetical protein [Cupriavidus sp.]MCA3209852.1 hypothetical protein [Cupriavidus sp.]